MRQLRLPELKCYKTLRGNICQASDVKEALTGRQPNFFLIFSIIFLLINACSLDFDSFEIARVKC